MPGKLCMATEPLANQLKAKLKNMKVSGKESHDIVINVAIEVKSIVKNLTELKMQEMLKYDDEYLSSILKILPEQQRNQWIEFVNLISKDYFFMIKVSSKANSERRCAVFI